MHAEHGGEGEGGAILLGWALEVADADAEVAEGDVVFGFAADAVCVAADAAAEVDEKGGLAEGFFAEEPTDSQGGGASCDMLE